MALFGSLRGVTIVAPDLDAAVAAYGEHLGYRGAPATVVTAARARAWGCPQAERCRMATLYPASGTPRFIRLVESDVPDAYRPLVSPGWAAAEIIVDDLDWLADRLAHSGAFEIIGPPAVLPFEFTDQIRAMQVRGPAREVLYLTEVTGEVPGFALPGAQCAVDSLFVAILAAQDLSASARWYSEQAGVDAPTVIETPIAVISAALGLPDEHRHQLATIALPDRTLIEIDALPGVATRPHAACGLPAGIAVVTLDTLDPVEDGRVLVGPDGEMIELIARA